MAIGFVIVNAQNMFTSVVLALSSLMRSYYSFDKNSFFDKSLKKPQRLAVSFALKDNLIL